MPKYRVERHPVTQPSDPSIRLIPLTQGQNAIIDAADFDWLSQWNWFARWSTYTQSFYAMRHGEPKVSMHRQILGCDEDVDHINHQTLDNRRLNLRPATKSQNAANQAKRKGSSKYKGVSWYKNYRKWVAQIGAQNQRRRLGYFVSEEDAGRAYDSAAIALHGKFAHLNFPS